MAGVVSGTYHIFLDITFKCQSYCSQFNQESAAQRCSVNVNGYGGCM